MKLFMLLLFSGLYPVPCFVVLSLPEIPQWSPGSYRRALLRPLACLCSLGILSTFSLSATSLVLVCVCVLYFLKTYKILKAQKKKNLILLLKDQTLTKM